LILEIVCSFTWVRSEHVGNTEVLGLSRASCQESYFEAL